MSLQTSILAVLGSGVLLLLYIAYRKFRNRYVGVGWILQYDPETKHVFVRTRLLKSPAGRARIPIGVIVLEENGVSQKFDTLEDFKKARGMKRRVGEELRYKLQYAEDDVRTIALRAEVIQGPIPVYTNRDIRPSPYVRIGLAHCEKTGVWYQTWSPSDAALDRVMHSR